MIPTSTQRLTANRKHNTSNAKSERLCRMILSGLNSWNTTPKLADFMAYQKFTERTSHEIYHIKYTPHNLTRISAQILIPSSVSLVYTYKNKLRRSATKIPKYRN